MRLIFCPEHLNPHISAVVIYHEQEILVTSRGCRRDWATDVGMDQLQRALGSVRAGLQEQRAMLLAQRAPVAELICVLEHGQPAHHALSATWSTAHESAGA